MPEQPMVTRHCALDMQVCVPSEWTDDQVKDFADRENPCGTTHGWAITREGDKALRGDGGRVSCQGNDRKGYVHIMLHA